MSDSTMKAAAQPDRMRSLLFTAAKLAGSVFFLWLALRKVSFGEVAGIAGHAAAVLLLAGVLLIMLQVPLTGVRWSRVSTAIGQALPFRAAATFALIGFFFNMVLPSGIGGDGVRILLAGRRGGNLRLAATSVLVDRVATLLGLVVLVEIGMPFLWPSLPLPEQRYALPAIGVGTLAGFVLLTVWRRFGRFVPVLNKVRFLDDLSAGAEQVFLTARASLPVLALATVGQVLSCLVLWTLAAALRVPIGLGPILLVFPLVTLIIVLPITIAGWGLRESAMTYALGLFGVPSDQAVTLSLVFGIANIVAFLPGAFAWLTLRQSAPLQSVPLGHQP